MRTNICLLLIFISLSSYAQDNFKQVVEKVDWKGTETDIVYSLHNYIEKSKHEEWDFENTESNYSFKNISIAGLPVIKSFIRVDKDNKKLYRLNFVFLHEETDLTIYPKIEDYLQKHFGISDNLKWVFDDFIMEASFLDLSNVMTKEIEEYSYVISLEPIHTFYVNWEKAIVESNNSRNTIPQIELFRIDNQNNVYIKEKSNELVTMKCDKIIPTPKGKVVVFNGGMFCYRKEDNDIVYIKNGFAVSYPICNKQ